VVSWGYPPGLRFQVLGHRARLDIEARSVMAEWVMDSWWVDRCREVGLVAGPEERLFVIANSLGHDIPDSKMDDEAVARRLVERWLADETLATVALDVDSGGAGDPLRVGVNLTPMVVPPGVEHDGATGSLDLDVEGVDVLRPSRELAEFARCWLADAARLMGADAGTGWVELRRRGAPPLHTLVSPPDPGVGYVVQYGWMVVLSPDAVDRLGGLDRVERDAPVVEAQRYDDAGATGLVLQVTSQPVDMDTTVLRRWRDFLAPVIPEITPPGDLSNRETRYPFVLDEDLGICD